MKKNSVLVLLVCLVFYAGLYIATSKQYICEGDCEKLIKITEVLQANKSYVYGASRCTGRQGSDTLCVYVQDTIGIDWNNLADTTCHIAQENGLFQQKVFVIKNGTFPNDTVARKICF